MQWNADIVHWQNYYMWNSYEPISYDNFYLYFTWIQYEIIVKTSLCMNFTIIKLSMCFHFFCLFHLLQLYLCKLCMGGLWSFYYSFPIFFQLMAVYMESWLVPAPWPPRPRPWRRVVRYRPVSSRCCVLNIPANLQYDCRFQNLIQCHGFCVNEENDFKSCWGEIYVVNWALCVTSPCK